MEPGTKLGRYEIRSLIGAGGMGEVYLARDPKIGRDVAIKVLPAALSGDKERLARFEQEAQAAGSLNHPNILAIYDVQTANGAPYVVSELLEGETLRERINGAALPTRKAIDYALQITHGLAAAHEKGIVHRDLKPENLFITKDGRVKILDFGLAKLTQPDGAVVQTDIPTRRVDTDPGTVMGTLGYMSPEQVRGRPVDHRSDIFSFGAILYEMFSGKRAFHGESTADTMSAILREEPPDLSETNKSVAPGLERVINHCLEKNPEERFHSARDLAFAIEALSGSTSLSGGVLAALPPRKRWRSREGVAWVATSLALIAAAVLGTLYFRRPAIDERTTRFVVAMPEKATEVIGPVISPDGRTITFIGVADGRRQLYIRPLDSVTAQTLPGTEEAVFPFWSPDSRYIGFFSNNKLKKIEVTGGPAQTLCDAPSGSGGTWNSDGVILFGRFGAAISRVSAAGGVPASVLTLNDARKEREQDFPMFLPDGRHFLYYSWNGNVNDTGIYAASIDGGEPKLVVKNDSNFAYSPLGYLLFARASTVMAQAFDAGKLGLSGDPFPIAENVTFAANISYSNFSISENGVLVYHGSSNASRRLVWFDRSGKELSAVGPPGSYNDVVLSPDNKRAALQRVEGGNTDIWLIDLVRGVLSRFTFKPSVDDDPAWSPDGNSIIFTSTEDGTDKLYRKISSGAGDEELLSDYAVTAGDGIDWSSDGKYVLFKATGQNTVDDLGILPLDGESAPYLLLQSNFNEWQGKFSPDGRWFAYISSESGRPEVYVQSFPLSGGKWQISNGGGGQPHWRRDGKELYYIASDSKLMVVDIKPGTTFEMGTPTALFQTRVSGYTAPNRYDVSIDGQRFLVNSPVEEASKTPITVVLNWTSTIKK